MINSLRDSTIPLDCIAASRRPSCTLEIEMKYRRKNLNRGADVPWLLGLLLTAGVILCNAGSRPLFAQSQVPELTGDRLNFSDVDPGAWQTLADEIAKFEESCKLTCYLVVVKSSGAGPTATRDDSDGLYEEWTQQSIRNNIPFDRQRSVLIRHHPVRGRAKPVKAVGENC